jgi:hypothetical protein
VEQSETLEPLPVPAVHVWSSVGLTPGAEIQAGHQSPATFCDYTGLDPEAMTPLLKMAHTIPDQAGQIFSMTNPKMAALWHIDLGPGVERVLDEVGEHHDGATVVSQDLTVFNLTADGVVTRQAVVDDSPAPVHGPSVHEPGMEEPVAPPEWFTDALLDI